jgi:hypothetical protein
MPSKVGSLIFAARMKSLLVKPPINTINMIWLFGWENCKLIDNNVRILDAINLMMGRLPGHQTYGDQGDV